MWHEVVWMLVVLGAGWNNPQGRGSIAPQKALAFQSFGPSVSSSQTLKVDAAGSIFPGDEIQGHTESFEPSRQPFSWTVVNSIPSENIGWRRTARRAHSGLFSAFHNDDDAGEMYSSWLITPPLQVHAASGDTLLVFWQSVNYGGWYHYHGVWISPEASTDTASFQELAELVPDVQNEDTWLPETLNLARYAGKTIRLAFVYRGNFADEWYLDDISVPPALEKTRESSEQIASLQINGLSRNTTSLWFNLPIAGEVTVNLYDTTGRRIRTLVRGTFDAGPHTLQAPLTDLSAGVYLVVLKGPSLTVSRRFVLVR